MTKILNTSLIIVQSTDVLQGVYKGQKVAVKSLLDDSHAAQTFLAEASIMTYVLSLVSINGNKIP